MREAIRVTYPTKYASADGIVKFSRYQATGEIAFEVWDAVEFEPMYRPSVTIVDWGARLADPEKGEVWIKTWSENQGVLEALIKADIIEFAGEAVMSPFGTPCCAVLCRLTPAAFAHFRREVELA